MYTHCYLTSVQHDGAIRKAHSHEGQVGVHCQCCDTGHLASPRPWLGHLGLPLVGWGWSGIRSQGSQAHWLSLRVQLVWRPYLNFWRSAGAAILVTKCTSTSGYKPLFHMNMFSHNCGKVSFDLVFKNMTKFTVLPVKLSASSPHVPAQSHVWYIQHTATQTTHSNGDDNAGVVKGCDGANRLSMCHKCAQFQLPIDSMHTSRGVTNVHLPTTPSCARDLCSLQHKVSGHTEELLNHSSAQSRNGDFKTLKNKC